MVDRFPVSRHPLENADADDEDSWAELILLVIIALLASGACTIWDGAVDGWHFLLRRARR